jgi:hypothetical protein
MKTRDRREALLQAARILDIHTLLHGGQSAGIGHFLYRPCCSKVVALFARTEAVFFVCVGIRLIADGDSLAGANT